VLAALGAGADRLSAGDLPRDKNDWIEVRTANFRLWSDAGERRTRAAGTELEQLRAALAQLSPSLAVASPCPTYLYVFKDRFAFTPYRFRFEGKRVEAAAYFAHRPWGNYVALDGDPRSDALHGIRHEYIHFLLHNNYARLPLWLAEGLAEFYGTFQVVDGEAHVGERIDRYIDSMRESPAIPLSRLFAVDQSSKDYHEEARQGMFYAESWALTHYLMLGNPTRRPQLTRMVKLMQAGTTHEDAFAKSFGGDYEALQNELSVYVHKKVFLYLRTPVKIGAEAPATVQPLAWPDALYRLGDLLLNTDQEAEAAEHFQAALAANPRHGLAAAGLGEIDEKAGRRAAALARYEQAAQLAPQEPHVHYLLGSSLLAQVLETRGGRVAARTESGGQAGQGGPDGSGKADGRAAAERGGKARQGGPPGPAGPADPAERAAAELARAAELAPDFGEVWSRLGLALLSVDAASARATTALETAQRLLPARADVTLNLALAYASRGEREKAAAAIARAKGIHASPEQLEKAREDLLRADFNAAGRLVDAGKLEEAVPILERVAAATHRKDFGEQVATELGRVRQALARQRFTAAYNQAVELANHGDTAAAMAKLETLLAGAPDPADAAQAKQLLEQLRARRKSKG
jgi:tetratricopeptide (TPR) repeat protein